MVWMSCFSSVLKHTVMVKGVAFPEHIQTVFFFFNIIAQKLILLDPINKIKTLIKGIIVTFKV